MAQQSAGQIKKYIKQLKQRQEQYLYYLGQLAYQEGDAGKLENPQMLEAYQTLREIQEQISQWEASLEQIKAAKAEAKQPKCPHCGSAVVKGAVYCPNCGQVVTAPPAAVPAAAPPAAAPAPAPPATAAPAPSPPAAAAAPEPAGKKCAKCGEPMDEDAVFCGNCGAKVAEEQAAPGTAPPPAAEPEPAPSTPSPEPEAEASTPDKPQESESPAPAGEAKAEEDSSGGVCPGCGVDVSDESALFCPECGTKVKE